MLIQIHQMMDCKKMEMQIINDNRKNEWKRWAKEKQNIVGIFAMLF